MFYCTQNQQYVQEGTPFEINGVQYPANWLNLSTPEEKTAIGLEEVIATNSREDDRYYWVSETLNGAQLTYINTPKDLTALKASAISSIDSQAYSLLVPTDYMDSRKANDSAYVPPAAWITWRASIRTQAATAKTAITASTDIPSLITASTVAWSHDPNYVVPTGN